MKELIDLLREARHELDSSHYINNRLSPLAKRLDAAIAKYEAEPERKCGTCRNWHQNRWGPFCNLNGTPRKADWFCADWQPKEGK